MSTVYNAQETMEWIVHLVDCEKSLDNGKAEGYNEAM